MQRTAILTDGMTSPLRETHGSCTLRIRLTQRALKLTYENNVPGTTTGTSCVQFLRTGGRPWLGALLGTVRY
eukprot:scaffold622885_cov17-Prasinocladus_malaysianus.AAC.1